MSHHSAFAAGLRQDKATTAPSSSTTTSVNRRLREALSPSPDASPRSPSPTHSRARDRSRSPYRASRSPSGAWKRRRNDDPREDSYRTDSRQHRRHYDDQRRHDDRQTSGRYDGREDMTRKDRGGHDNRDSHNEYGSKRRRTRSPSPPSRARRSHSPAMKGDSAGRRDVPTNGSVNIRKQKDHTSVRFGDDKARISFRQGAGLSTSQTTQIPTSTSGQEQNGAPQPEKGVRFTLETKAAVEEPAKAPSAPVDEVVSIEERRKRREAIKAKYKSQATPLLVQALQQDSAPASPSSHIATEDDVRSERSVSPNMFAPQTPQTDSAAGSPPAVHVNDDTELARSAGASLENADEASAADYDPAADMAEERARHDKRNHDMQSSAYDETKQASQSVVLLPESVAEPKTQPKKQLDDMFADDDDDDMFATITDTKDALTNDEPNKAAVIPAAKELDQSLLDNWDDPEGYYRIILGELLDSRYHVQANLGKGMFSSVVRAQDNTNGELVAIKVIRNNETMLKAATKEMEILEKLADADPEDKKHMIRLKRSFTHKGHMCMVFEHMSDNLREILKKFGRDVGINLKAVRTYAQQMFLGLLLMRKCNILHADLKPDNILVNDARSSLKICDLGSAADASENEITPYLVSRFYRAPEIILGVPYDFAIDMWSIGCTLFEMYTGKILFTGRNNNQMLKSIMECRGKFSLKMLKKAEFGAVHFDDVSLNFRSLERDKVTGRDVTKMINFVKPTRDLKTRLIAATTGTGTGSKKVIAEADLKEVNLFADLLDRCLNLNPERRLTPAEALKHPFIHRSIAVPSSVRV